MPACRAVMSVPNPSTVVSPATSTPAAGRRAEAICPAPAPAAVVVQDVDAVIDAHADDQRQGDHVRRVQRHAAQPHHAERQHHADREREEAEREIA